jgi:hypothetical protein
MYVMIDWGKLWQQKKKKKSLLPTCRLHAHICKRRHETTRDCGILLYAGSITPTGWSGLHRHNIDNSYFGMYINDGFVYSLCTYVYKIVHTLL